MSMHFSWRWCWMFVVGFVAEARLDSVFLASSVVLTQQQIQMVGATNDSTKTSGDGDENQIDCIKEDHLDLTHLDMVNNDHLRSKTLRSCAEHCLETHPLRSHLLIAYKKRAVLSDHFICACADESAYEGLAPVLPEAKCVKECPDDGRYRCGDAGNDVLSVYCLKRGCLPGEVLEEPVCAKRMPHDPHGCVEASQINWSHAHNVRNFTDANVNGDVACVWECHDHHPSAMYTLSRRVGDVLTCSCGYPRAFEPVQMIDTEFCEMLPTDKDLPFYRVNCVSDLDEDGEGGGLGEGLPPLNGTCDSVFPLGCAFEEFVSNSSLSTHVAVTDPGDAVADPQSCQSACFALNGAVATHVAVRWDSVEQTMHCYCMRPGAIAADMLGPDAACSTNCEPEGTGLTCGGPYQPPKDGDDDNEDDLDGLPIKTLESLPPAVTVYCLHRGAEESIENENPDDWALTLYGSKSILIKIHESMYTGYVTADVMVAMLTVLCVLLMGIVIYLCVSKGVVSVSRRSM